MEYNLKYIAKEYAHGWSVWIERDGKKTMIGSAIKNEKDIYNLINNIAIEKHYQLEENKVKVSTNNRTVFQKEEHEDKKFTPVKDEVLNVDIDKLLDEYNDYLKLYKLFNDEEYLMKAESIMTDIKNNF